MKLRVRGILFQLVLLAPSITYAQTTMDEYNYLTKGYRIQLESGLDMKRGYYFTDVGQFDVPYQGFSRTTTIKHLCREVDSLPCATLIIHERKNTAFLKYLCVPHVSSKVEVWQKAKEDYWTAMYDWDEAAKAFSWNLMRSMAIPAPIRKEPTSFAIDEEMPSFPNGEAALMQYIRENLRYPATAQSAGVAGTVHVTFIVTQTGGIRDAKVKSGIGSGCDEEALRVINAMPKWNPGKQRGKPVDVQYNLAIRFSAQK
ncbi:MAG: energy transducer TonB [Flavobacteriales bacterium]|nr:energy transducer TonB [Flavobacteriales bacterium]MCC6939233.1 energy transducer TonB [Flavobacteriales bacterium]